MPPLPQDAGPYDGPILDDPSRMRQLSRHMRRGRCVLFDFDGPLCRLFPDGASAPLADVLRRHLAGRGALDLLPPDALVSIDPQAVLRAVDQARPGDALVAELEQLLVAGERAAAAIAPPAPDADLLVRRLGSAGVRMAVTTNNSPSAVAVYLRRAGLDEYFAGHVYGRTDDPRQLKPNPHCLLRALDGLGARADEAVMIGDTPTDHRAADFAGVAFAGYAADADEAKGLWEAGADFVFSRYDLLSLMIPARSS